MVRYGVFFCTRQFVASQVVDIAVERQFVATICRTGVWFGFRPPLLVVGEGLSRVLPYPLSPKMFFHVLLHILSEASALFLVFRFFMQVGGGKKGVF